jgi:hypothetical protein
MKDIGNVYFDEVLDGFVNIPEGTYPAHLTTLEVFDTKTGGKRFKSTFKLAEETGELTINKVTKQDAEFINVLGDDGEPITINGSVISGKLITGTSFVTPNPAEGEGWKNRKYIDFFSNMGVQFPDVDGKTKVMEIEESDVIGLPVRVKVGPHTWEGADGTNVMMQVVKTYPWFDGVKLDPSELEDLPF